MTIATDLREAAAEIRRTSMPLADLIPLLQRAADALDAIPEDKLAVMIWYLEQRRVSRISDDARAFDSYLDDPEIMNWLDRMKKTNRIVNTRFTDKGR